MFHIGKKIGKIMITKLLSCAKSYAKDFIDIIMPAVCVGCNRERAVKHNYCTSCLVELLHVAATNYCPRCGSSAGKFARANIETGCSECPTILPRFSRVYRIGPYQGVIKHSIRALKYDAQFHAVDHLAKLLCYAIDQNQTGTDYDMIMPIPMYWFARLTRGIDHTKTIAYQIARHLNIHHVNYLFKHKNIPPQVKLSRTKRIENVLGAFGISKPNAVKNKKILLVDDVTTTGATASEAARMLIKAGCYKVDLAVIAKAEKTNPYSQEE